MNKSALLALLFLNGAQAGQLTSYADIVDAVHNGQGIRYVVDWDLCKTSVPDIAPEFSSSYTPDHVVISKKGALASRGMTYTHEVRQLPGLGPVNQSYVFMLTSDNTLKIINRFLDPVTYVEKIPAWEATCVLGEGLKVFSVG